MSSKKNKKSRGKTMNLQDFHLSVPSTPANPTTQSENQSSRKSNQQSQQKRDVNRDSSNWRSGDSGNTTVPETEQSKYVNRDRYFSNNSKGNNETHMDNSSRNKPAEFASEKNNSSVSAETNQRGLGNKNTDSDWAGRVQSSGRGRGRAPFNKDSAQVGPKISNANQNQSYLLAFETDNKKPDISISVPSSNAEVENQAGDVVAESEMKDESWSAESISENVQSSVEKKPKFEQKIENDKQAGTSGVSSRARVNKKEEPKYIPPAKRDEKNKEFAKPSHQQNSAGARDRDHGQRSRSHSRNRHHSQDRRDHNNTQQNRGRNVQKGGGYSDNKPDMYEKFKKWENANFPALNSCICKLVEVEGDLFDASSEYALAHCVAEDFSMGSGIAVKFRQEFKRVDDLLAQSTRQGGVAHLKEDERYIFYMVTKKKSNGKPTYLSFCKSLDKLRQKIEELNVKKLAIPRIGCGLDRLEWSVIFKMIEFIFANTDVEIKAYNYVQKDDDPMQSQSQKPRTCRIHHVKLDLISMESQTGLVFLASEDHEVTPEIRDIDKKFNFIQDYKQDRRKLGDVFSAVKKGEYIYGLYVKKRITDDISYKSLGECLKKLQKDKDLYYIGIQAFLDESDNLVMDKIQTMCKNFLNNNKEVYFCWPKDLEHLMPF